MAVVKAFGKFVACLSAPIQEELREILSSPSTVAAVLGLDAGDNHRVVRSKRRQKEICAAD